MIKCESLRINMFRITHTGKISKFSRNKASTTSLLELVDSVSAANLFEFVTKDCVIYENESLQS